MLFSYLQNRNAAVPEQNNPQCAMKMILLSEIVKYPTCHMSHQNIRVQRQTFRGKNFDAKSVLGG